MKDGSISKLLITKTGHRPTSYKEIVHTLLVLCADKNYLGRDDIIWNGIDQVETDFMSTCSEATHRSNTHHVEIETIDPSIALNAVAGLYPCIVTLVQQTHSFNSNL